MGSESQSGNPCHQQCDWCLRCFCVLPRGQQLLNELSADLPTAQKFWFDVLLCV